MDYRGLYVLHVADSHELSDHLPSCIGSLYNGDFFACYVAVDSYVGFAVGENLADDWDVWDACLG